MMLNPMSITLCSRVGTKKKKYENKLFIISFPHKFCYRKRRTVKIDYVLLVLVKLKVTNLHRKF